MCVAKLIQSGVFAAGLALVLLAAGCASADRTAPQERDEPRGGTPTHQPVEEREPDDEDDDAPKYARHSERDDTDRGASKAPRANAASPRSAKSGSAVTAAPSLDELPDLKPLGRRSIAARIDVQGSMETTKRPVVPSYKEVPLTPEEKKALGEERERPDDLLAFYKPQPSVRQGVSTRDGGAQIGIGGPGGASVGIGRDTPRFGTFGQAGTHAGNYGPVRHISGADISAPILARVGPSFVVLIGWGPPRSGAGQMPYLEP